MLSNLESQPLGFISVRVHPEHGYFGGLLLVNHLARPLEFHCSLPFKPTRAQTILYGPTLEDFLCGEQIARALCAKMKSPPVAIFTDTESVLSLRHLISEPVALVELQENTESRSVLRVPSQKTEHQLYRFQVAGYTLAIQDAVREDAEKICDFWRQTAPQLDLVEPFGRIGDALLEAQPAAKAA